MLSKTISSDYVIIGAGAMGLAFADTLFHEDPKAHIVIVDKRAKPGGHWVDAYPYVTLHQPAAAYGVNSSELGTGGSDLSSHAEIIFYFEQALKKLVSSGRVTFLSQCICEDMNTNEVSVQSLLDSDTSYKININKKLVDATYMNVKVPATHPPKYTIDAKLTLIPPNGLAKNHRPWDQYTIIGAGKTGIDAALFLIDSGVSADKIQWIVSNDMWLWNRAKVQTNNVIEELVKQIKTLKSSTSINDIFLQLETLGSMFRLDADNMPKKWRCATVSPEEFLQLKTIKNLVRLGRVKEITQNEIRLDNGSIPTNSSNLHIDCSANGLEQRPPTAIFEGKRITLQSVFMCQQVFSAAVIAKLETLSMSDERRNNMWQVVPHPEFVEDFPEGLVQSLENTIRANKAIPWWLMKCRLNIMSHLPLPQYLVASIRAILVTRGSRQALKNIEA